MQNEITFPWDEKEEHDFARARLSYRVGGPFTRSAAVVLGLILIVGGLAIISDKTFGGLVCVGVGGFFLLRGVGFSRSLFIQERRNVGATSLHIALSRDALTVKRTTPNGMITENYPWLAYEDCVVDNDGVLLAFYGRKEVWIPSSAFQSSEERDAFCNSIVNSTDKAVGNRSTMLRVLAWIARLFGR